MDETSVDTSTEGVEPVEAVEPTVSAKPTTTQPEMVSLKIDGKVVEMTKEKALALAQKGFAADKRFEEAAKTKKEAEELVSLTKQKDFLKLAERSGMTKAEARASLEEVLLKLYEEEDLSPQEREMRELKAFKEQRDAELKAAQEAETQEKISKEEAKYLQEIEEEMVTALGKTTLPNNPLYAKLAANYMAAGLNQGYDLSPTDAVKLVEQDQLALVKSLLDNADPSRLESLLGPKVVKAIRDAGVAGVKKAEASLKKPTVTPPPAKPVPPTQGTPRRSRDIFDEIRRGVGSL